MKYIITGPQGSGKTTLAARLARGNDSYVIDEGELAPFDERLKGRERFIVVTQSEWHAAEIKRYYPEASLIRLEGK